MASKKKSRAGTARRASRPARKPARKRVQPVPAAYGSLTPALVFKDARKAIDLYTQIFGAKVTTRMDTPDGRVMHAELKIGDSILMVGDEDPRLGIRSAETLGGASGAQMLYVKDCDAVFAKAVAAGSKVLLPLGDMFWGDRYGQLVDPLGHRWGIATHKADLTKKQMAKAAAAAMAQAAPAGGPPPAG